MALRVLSVAYPFAPVTADPAGGAEQVLAQLDRALVAAGAESLVLAPEGSSVAGRLLSVPAVAGDIDESARAAVHGAVRAALAEVVARRQADLIHLHGIDFADYLPPPGVPVLVTLHLPLDWYPAGALAPKRPATFLHPVSADQARRASPGARLLMPIPNGVDLSAYTPVAVKGGYALVIGRVAPEKGFHHALDAARRAGMELCAAGKIYGYAAHRAYFDEQVKPRLDERRRWLGPVEGAAKRRLIAEAACVLIPSTAPETSSLVAMEALASGTPVIAFRAGALPEIVEHGVTGFVVDDAEEMAAAMGRLGAIDPAACRRVAEARFDLRTTVAAYLHLYRRLA
jgi:glycosyltransferase involved in cell wall biosynthesis